MDASVLQNQLKQKLRQGSQGKLIDTQSPPSKSSSAVPSRSASAEPSSSTPSISRSPSKSELVISAATLPVAAASDAGKPLVPQPSIESSSSSHPPLPLRRPSALVIQTASQPSEVVTKNNISPVKPVLPLESPIGNDDGQLKRVYLPEAPSLPVTASVVGLSPGQLPPQSPSSPDKTHVTENDEGFSDAGASPKTSESGTFGASSATDNSEKADDEWETDRPKPSPIQIERFTLIVSQLRIWFASRDLPLSGARSIDEELRSGVALCKLLAKVSNREQILVDLQQDYSPALASLSEWKNNELFIKQAKDIYPKLAVLSCEAKDLFNGVNIPNFLTFLWILGKESVDRIHLVDASKFAPIPSDVSLLMKQSPAQYANCLSILDEDEAKKASPLYSWLKEIKLHEYYAQFIENGWDDLEKISLMEEEDLRAIGIKKEGHLRLLNKRLQDIALYSQWITASAGIERSLDYSQSEAAAMALSAAVTTTTTSSTSVDIDLSSGNGMLLEDAILTMLRLQEQTKKSNLEGVQDSLLVASHLLNTCMGSEYQAIVIDFAPQGYAMVGCSGSTVPTSNISFGSLATHEDVVQVIVRALDKLGISREECKGRKIFVIGTSPTRALQEFLLSICPNGVYMCSHKSAAAIALRAVGLVDGISLDIDSSGVARTVAINSGRAIPQGFMTELIDFLPDKNGVDSSEAEKKREKSLLGLISSCLTECGFGSATNKRIRGGLVVTGTRITFTPGLLKRFSAGVFCVQPNARWGAASQIANHPDFQHRWMTSKDVVVTTKSDEQLFPLMTVKYRKNVAFKALMVASTLERTMRLKEEALRLDQMNALNAKSPHFVSPSDNSPRNKRPLQTPPLKPPHPLKAASNNSQGHAQSPRAKEAKAAAGRALPDKYRTNINQVDQHIAELLQSTFDDKVILDFKMFLLKDIHEGSGETCTFPFHKVLASCPPALKKQLKQAGVIFLNEDENVDDELVDML